MDNDQLVTIIAGLDSRLRRLENKLYGADGPVVHETRETPQIATPRPRVQKAPSDSTNLLGILGVGCLVVAMILLIKFSIDSGWLNPYRQLLLAALFGGSLVAVPFLVKSDDRTYVSLLPSAGIVILHLTLYGGVFYHRIVDPVVGLWSVWAIGALSLWLLTTFKEDIFAIFAIAGTYLGSFLLKDSFADFWTLTIHLLVWDLVFAGMAIKLKNRSLISLAAYFSLGLVVFLASALPEINLSLAKQIAILQLAQILVFAIFTSIYSVKHKIILTEREAWMLFPVFMFFYGQEFYFINLIGQNYATGFSLFFAGTILLIYNMARKKIGREHLESSGAVLTFVAVMILHSVYFVMLGDLARLYFGLGLMGVLFYFREQMKSTTMMGTLALSIFVIGFSTMLILIRTGDLSLNQTIVFGFIYGVAFFAGFKKSKNVFLLSVANISIIFAICRLKDLIGEIWIGPLCVAYAFACLLMALKWSDKLLARAALPVIVFAIGRFWAFNFSNLSPLERIISLIVMGGLIYAGGLVYRKIPNMQSHSKLSN